MNLNNFLCSHFEPNKDGKVTIGNVADIVIKLSIIAVILCLITAYLGAVFTYLCEEIGIINASDLSQYIVDGEVIGSMIFFFLVGLLSILLVVVIFAATILAAYIYEGICSIPIASCPIKKEEKDDTD